MSLEREILLRLPLAEAVLLLFAYVLDEAFLEDCFQRYRGRHYSRLLGFAQLVYLVRDALIEHGGSARQSFQRAQQNGTLPVAIASAYAKLGRLPIPVSMALLRQATQRLHDLLASRPAALPPSLQKRPVIVLDGKTIKHATRRLKPLRGRAGAVTGGKLLAALSLRDGLALAMQATPDADCNDLPLVPGLLAQLDRAAEPVLWVADRQYCDLRTTARCSEGPHDFLIRYSRNVAFQPDPARPAHSGRDADGRPWREVWGWLGAPSNPRHRYVRWIRLQRPGQEDLILITSLLDGQAYPAADLLAVYQQRWGIERMFQQVTEVFTLRRLIGSRPEAMIFQAAFCLLLYNLIQVVRAYVAGAGAVEGGGGLDGAGVLRRAAGTGGLEPAGRSGRDGAAHGGVPGSGGGAGAVDGFARDALDAALAQGPSEEACPAAGLEAAQPPGPHERLEGLAGTRPLAQTTSCNWTKMLTAVGQ